MATATVLYPSQGLPSLPDLESGTRGESGALLGDSWVQAVTGKATRTALRSEPRREGTLVGIRALERASEARRKAVALVELAQREFKWLSENRLQYARRWVALDGDHLLAVGDSAREVFAAIRDYHGTPLVTQVEPAEDVHFAGW